ncbi:AMP phosphorylase [Candidatus Micrarchaeota archaeon CG1_02_47_40]|nr:MAG: AMP phosphorylase [Candidatus Micrarchaeota archaeon CG1_02_47_40]
MVWGKKDLSARAKCFDMTSGRKIVVLNEEEAIENDIYPSYRVMVENAGKQTVAIANLSRDLVKRGEIGIYVEVSEELSLHDGTMVRLRQMDRPSAIEFIKKKLDGKEIGENEMKIIIADLMDNRLSEAELSAFITAMYIRGTTDNEVVYLSDAIVESGDVLDIQRHPIVDKHCIGGIAGNRTTMLVVPICAAAGLFMPKTSSRSITSAAGTADTMEVLAPVDLEIEEVKEVVLKSHGCIVWGGGMNLASADDRLIRIRHPLSLDPKGVMLASILAKKKSVCAEYVVIDIPVGRGAKISDPKEANSLANDFISIGKRLGMKIEVLITDGSDPIGCGVGPALECRDVFDVLEGKGPSDLRDKSCQMAGVLMELCKKVEKGKGYAVANEIISSRKALSKFREIIELQGGNGKVKRDEIEVGKYAHEVLAHATGRISHVDNRMISKIARAAGAPADKGAGLYMNFEQGDRVKKGEVLFKIYAQSEAKLDFAIKTLESWEAFELQKVILNTVE